ncbi:hypothetical protein C882_3397 [Caenispirillum salinarum AK4]|uniref:Uncharacterized protein n=1 Tax=Caenispirillum salinarum AK4 TaxID=1238182 RepID=K9GLI5_9PROT|nr:hypothetical protein C882_3397 [Caenispirillum salinarum AK4]
MHQRVGHGPHHVLGPTVGGAPGEVQKTANAAHASTPGCRYRLGNARPIRQGHIAPPKLSGQSPSSHSPQWRSARLPRTDADRVPDPE